MHFRVYLAIVTLAAGIAALALAGESMSPVRRDADAQGATTISVPDCVEVDEGNSFTIEIEISRVDDLHAWEVYFAYDKDLLEVTGRSVRIFLDEEPNSNVFDFSDSVPNTSGIYRLGAADLSTEEGTAEAGNGVLATLSLTAKDSGVSWAELYRADLNGDDQIDFGPTLTGNRGAHIGDSDGDGIFDGSLNSGQVAIAKDCEEVAPTAPPQGGVVIQPSLSAGVTTGTPGAGDPTLNLPTTTAGGPEGSGSATPTATPADSPTPPQAGGGGTTTSSGGTSSGWLLYAVIIAGATAGVIGAGWALTSARRTN